MKIEEILAFIKDASDDDKSQILAKLGAVSKEDSDEAVAQVQAKLDDANTQVAAKESIIQAAKAKSEETDSEENREKIRAEVRAEIEAESKAKAAVVAQVQKAGLKVVGETAAEIMADAIEQAGGTAKDESDNLFSNEVLNQIWSSVAQMRGANQNADEINALGAGQNTGVSQDSPVLQGSRAARIKANRGG